MKAALTFASRMSLVKMTIRKANGQLSSQEPPPIQMTVSQLAMLGARIKLMKMTEHQVTLYNTHRKETICNSTS